MKTLALATMLTMLMLASSAFAAPAAPATTRAAPTWDFHPSAVPLVVHDPYFSIWSMSDRLTDEWPKHWTGAPHALCGMVRVDGKPYRILGANPSDKVQVPAMEQQDLYIFPTVTLAMFNGAGVEVLLAFESPKVPADIDSIARPVTYVSIVAHSNDDKPHDVQVYLDACAEIAVHTPDQAVVLERVDTPGLATMRTGTVAQDILKRAGDGVRIDWGHLYMSTSEADKPLTAIGNAEAVRGAFVVEGKIGSQQEQLGPRAVNDGWPVLACAFDLGKIDDKPATRRVMLAYDEEYAVEYMGQRLRPYWRRNGMDAPQLLAAAAKDYDRLHAAAEKFSPAFTKDFIDVGGGNYLKLCTLAYRQALAGHGFAAAPDGRLFMFAKENSSNGCIGTVDVIYPAAPIFLLFSPTMMEANLAPVFEYAALPRWTFPFAPHDLGTYPLANGQVYGGGEKTEKDQMPVEESANMLILVAAMEKATDVPSKLAETHRALLRKWADYLVEKGLDPENQLCTDDFTGHLAHNVNLSAKAILGIAAYGQICENHEDRAEGKRYLDKAKEMSAQWVTMAGDGDHTKLAFDKEGTWSQKYNLVWDRVLGLNLFPREVTSREVRYYLKKSTKYGPPLDNRAAFTKLDWTAWSACLADDQMSFEALINPLYYFSNDSKDRVPLSDWYHTDTAKVAGFRARPVVGGVFMKMLCDEQRWKKWALTPPA